MTWTDPTPLNTSMRYIPSDRLHINKHCPICDKICLEINGVCEFVENHP
jgi:hypothetical protein